MDSLSDESSRSVSDLIRITLCTDFDRPRRTGVPLFSLSIEKTDAVEDFLARVKTLVVKDG